MVPLTKKRENTLKRKALANPDGVPRRHLYRINFDVQANAYFDLSWLIMFSTILADFCFSRKLKPCASGDVFV